MIRAILKRRISWMSVVRSSGRPSAFGSGASSTPVIVSSSMQLTTQAAKTTAESIKLTGEIRKKANPPTSAHHRISTRKMHVKRMSTISLASGHVVLSWAASPRSQITWTIANTVYTSVLPTKTFSTFTSPALHTGCFFLPPAIRSYSLTRYFLAQRSIRVLLPKPKPGSSHCLDHLRSA